VTVTHPVDDRTLTVTFQVLVVEDGTEEPTVVSIAVTTPPTVTEYQVGEALDLTGLVVTATLSDGSTRQVAAGDLTVTGYDPSLVGTQTVTVAVGGFSATFQVTVAAPPAPVTLTGLQVVTPPAVGTYIQGTALDLTGLVVEATYSDGNTRPVPVDSLTVSGFDPLAVGEQTVTLTLLGAHGDSAQAAFTVTVTSPPPGPGPGDGSGPGAGGGAPDSGAPDATTPAPPAGSASELRTSDGVSGGLSSQRVQAGGTVTVTASGFAAGETVQVWLYSSPVFLGRVVADAAGVVTTTVTIPAGLAAGAHSLVLVGETSGLVYVGELEVVASGVLSTTGATGVVWLALAAGVLLVAGSWLVVARRRGVAVRV
jgi:hypothetical protein